MQQQALNVRDEKQAIDLDSILKLLRTLEETISEKKEGEAKRVGPPEATLKPE